MLTDVLRRDACVSCSLAFKCQVTVDRYIVDFLAPAAKLVVEVDGGVHSLRRTRDARRDRVLQRLGYRVLRIDAELVRTQWSEAVALICASLVPIVLSPGGCEGQCLMGLSPDVALPGRRVMR